MSHSPPLEVVPVPRGRVREAVQLLFAAHLSQQRDALVLEACQRLTEQPEQRGGLWGAWRGDSLRGVVWGQSEPGRLARMLGPALATEETPETGRALLQAVHDHLRRANIAYAQAWLEGPEAEEAALLLSAGYEHVANVQYMEAPAAAAYESAVSLPFALLPLALADDARLARILEATYQGSRDCPALSGLRSVEDEIAGYRAGGDCAPERWLAVRADDADVGCLLLADYPVLDVWEIAYVGLAPAARGRGWGLLLVQHALRSAALAGRARLVAAVDAANAPAVAMYQRAGFSTWLTRGVLVHSFAAARA